MKKLFYLIIMMVIFISCSTTDETPQASCQVNGITSFDEGASTRFAFTSDGNGGYLMTTIIVYENTDSSFNYTYTYNGTELQSISSSQDGANVTYNASYENGNLARLTTDGGGNELAGEIVLDYSGSNVSTIQTWVKASDGNLYQVGHFSLTYDGSGDLTKTEIHFDIVALFTIAFASVPTDPYTPAFFGSTEYEYGQDVAPNPMYGIYYMENPDMGFLKNIPINIIDKDETGSVIGSQGFTITLNESGYPTKATSGASYIEASYDCN